MKQLLKRIFNRQPPQPGPSLAGKVVRVDLDEIGPQAQDEVKEVALETSGLTFFEGQIEHGYSVDQVATTQKCPRCQAPTQQQYAHWIYATQVAPRVMMAPAGYFCSRCPTVIVDEAMIQQGIKKNFRYQGVLGLDYEQTQAPDLFRTWNGQPAIHILDEQGIPQGLSMLEGTPLRRSTRSHRTRKLHQRPPKKAKKRSRRKK